MVRDDLKAKLAEKLARKREKLMEKVGESESRRGEIEGELAELQVALTEVETEMQSLEDSSPGARERLVAHRERLLAKKERLEWKLESLDIRMEALRDAADQLEFQWDDSQRGSFFGHVPPVPPVPPVPHIPMPPHIPTPPRAPMPPRPTPRQLEEERLRILQMVAEGKITAEDAARLLQALSSGAEAEPPAAPKPRVLRVKVTDSDSGAVRVNLTMPLNFVRAALRRGGQHAPDINVGGVNLDADELESLLTSGVQGHIIDVMDEEDGERVEVFVE
ncbi:MAG: hypothetical protein RBT75_10440 [Anaerolineae bacterium]|jgi:hypothetical protein|nr:hypothetical protein [Anaerolineae bacterium]